MSQLAHLYDVFDTAPAPVVGFLRALAERRGLAGALRVLDVGAGTGRMIRPLAALGWRVTATEPDPTYRERLADVARAEGAAVTAEAFESLDHEAAFDLALAVNSAFAYLVTPEARADALARLHRTLRPGGVLFLDLPNYLWILKNYRAPEEQVRQRDGRTHRLRRRHEIDYDRATFTTLEAYTVVEPDGRETTEEKRHVYSMTAPPDLARLMGEAGFAEIEAHNEYGSRGAERLDGPRMLFTARKAP